MVEIGPVNTRKHGPCSLKGGEVGAFFLLLFLGSVMLAVGSEMGQPFFSRDTTEASVKIKPTADAALFHLFSFILFDCLDAFFFFDRQ